jgi:hypothetical protein
LWVKKLNATSISYFELPFTKQNLHNRNDLQRQQLRIHYHGATWLTTPQLTLWHQKTPTSR